MALIVCPECGKEISDKSSACIHCGFPLKTNVVQSLIVKKFNKGKARKGFNRWLFEINTSEYPDLKGNRLSEGHFVDFLDSENNILGTFKVDTYAEISFIISLGFDDVNDDVVLKTTALDLRIEQKDFTRNNLPNTVKCPTCGSSDVERVSTATKAKDVFFFGLFGNKHNKQFKCNRCDYMW